MRSQGDLMSRVTNDIDNLNQALTQSVVQIISSALTFIGVTIADVRLKLDFSNCNFNYSTYYVLRYKN